MRNSTHFPPSNAKQFQTNDLTYFPNNNKSTQNSNLNMRNAIKTKNIEHNINLERDLERNSLVM